MIIAVLLNCFMDSEQLTLYRGCTPVIDVQYYWSDSPYFTVLHDEAVVDAAPEAYAQDLADQWGSA